MELWLKFHREAREESYKAFRCRRDGKGKKGEAEAFALERVHYAQAAYLEQQALEVLFADNRRTGKKFRKRVVEFAENAVCWTFRSGRYEVAMEKARKWSNFICGDYNDRHKIWSGAKGWFNDPGWDKFWAKWRSPSNYQHIEGCRYLDQGTGIIVEVDLKENFTR